MKKISKLSLTFLVFFLFQMFALAAEAASPMGYWETIDDVTGKVKSIINIHGTQKDLSGTVVKLFPGALTVCSACEGPLKNQAIRGMTVMYGLKQDADNQNEWEDGTILDPKTGKIYHCKLTVADDGKSMVVRGYIGISLFGRSQTWLKVSGRRGE
jgi:uncharacterized protein (DUF2147 family)